MVSSKVVYNCLTKTKWALLAMARLELAGTGGGAGAGGSGGRQEGAGRAKKKAKRGRWEMRGALQGWEELGCMWRAWE